MAATTTATGPFAYATRSRNATGIRMPVVPPLSPAEERDLAARKLAGDAAAREALIVRNMPLALSMAAGRARGRRSGHLDTMVSVAMLALVGAVDGYRPDVRSRGVTVKLGTYLGRSIGRALRVADYREIPVVPVAHWVMRAEALGGRLLPGDESPARSFEGCRGRAAAALASRAFGEADDPRSAGVESIPAAEDGPGAHPSAPDLDRAIARLAAYSPAQAAVVRLLYPLDGSEPMGLTSAARRLGTTRQSVVTTRGRAIRNLRKFIEEQEAA